MNQQELKVYKHEWYLKNKDRMRELGKEWNKQHPDKLIEYRKNRKTDEHKLQVRREWRYRHPEKGMYERAKKRAARYGEEFNLEKSDIQIPDKCIYFGVPLVSDGSKGNFIPSLDRIDSSKGYVKGNVQVISFLANKMKQDATSEQLVAFAKGVMRLHGTRNSLNSRR